MKNKIILISTTLILGFIGFVVAKNIYQNKRDVQNVEFYNVNSKSDFQLIRNFNNSRGPELAKVTIVEFFDPECEGCRAFYPHLKSVLKEFEGSIRFVTRYMLYHSSSQIAALATEAARKQGKFWEYHELLFELQPEWSHKQVPQKDFFINYASKLGLDIKKFKKDMSDISVVNQLNLDIEDGNALGVRGTPTIFVNGQMLNNLDPNQLKMMIEEKLRN